MLTVILQSTGKGIKKKNFKCFLLSGEGTLLEVCFDEVKGDIFLPFDASVGNLLSVLFT